ncbi:LCP family protein required for cell wall assembly [Kitasatospora sp. MAA19]|uniref:LCP family protein n=1 Tax=unclassified Kitasatospora TaxID=2633591 RepID=UPI0024770240|nr:LCP family protein [Kitasatospora sp. MAA19]MDH6703864.1 LCP family protein required for cell wall assembly [Kitasatospora sp. MAA19]
MSGQWGEGPARGENEPGALTTEGGGAVPPPRTGGRAEARRAAQGKGGGRGGKDGGRDGGKDGKDGGRSEAAAGGGRAAARNSRKPKRNVKKIVAWSAAGVLVLIAGAGGAIYFKLNANIKSFDGDAIATDRPPEAQADADGNKPVNVLLIGSDSRGKNNADLGGGEDGGARSDTTILLHVYADHKHAVGISIPRNAMVQIPSCKLPNGKWTKGGTDLFNAAFSTGGSDDGNPACTQNTIEKLTGIRVDHTIVVDFNGFASMTKAVNGVDVCLPKAIYEGDINPNLKKKGDLVLPQGKQTVEGQKALDYVRLRHGIGDGSDIGRMKRQQAFLSSLATKVKKDGLSPTNLLPLADAATKSLTVDPGLASADKLLSFGLSLKNIDMHDLKFVTAPWRYRTQDANIDLIQPDSNKLWETLKADRTIDGQNATGQQPDAPASPDAQTAPQQAAPSTPAAPAADTSNASIKVAVYNGTINNGLAGKATEQLKAAKFAATTAGQAASTKYRTTMVEYGAGQKANAEKVAALFPGASVEAGNSPGVTLIVGKDFAAANGGTAPGAGGTTGAAASGTATGAPTPPAPLPTTVTNDARSADDDICANTTYGSGG